MFIRVSCDNTLSEPGATNFYERFIRGEKLKPAGSRIDFKQPIN